MRDELLSDLLWKEITLELINMGYEPEEAGRYAKAMVQHELESDNDE